MIGSRRCLLCDLVLPGEYTEDFDTLYDQVLAAGWLTLLQFDRPRSDGARDGLLCAKCRDLVAEASKRWPAKRPARKRGSRPEPAPKPKPSTSYTPPATDPLVYARWRLGLVPPYSASDVERAFRRVVSRERVHPDQGGTAEAFRDLVEQRDIAARGAA